MRSVTLVLALAACGGDSSDPGERPRIFGDDRPAELEAPEVLDDGREYPLVMVLHGYGFSGFGQAAYFQLAGLPDDNEALLIAPDGTVDSTNKQFWNADPICCDFDGSGVDDVGYLSKLLEDVIAAWPVDRSQVFVVGHSNGAFMGYRMACERADLITGGALLAGNTSRPEGACTPSAPVSMLILHGTTDDVVPYDGGSFGAGAVESHARWARYDGCAETPEPGTAIDLDRGVPGAETQVMQSACDGTLGVELWSHEGVGHVPTYSAEIGPVLWDWLTSHPR